MFDPGLIALELATRDVGITMISKPSSFSLRFQVAVPWSVLEGFCLGSKLEYSEDTAIDRDSCYRML